MLVLKGIRAWFRLLLFALFLTVAWSGDYRPTPLDSLVAPYRYDFLSWETYNLFDKWLHRAGHILPWSKSVPPEEQGTLVTEYFELGGQVRELNRAARSGDLANPQAAAESRSEIGALEDRRRELQARVEEILESAINDALINEGFPSWAGTVFPPVDTHFTEPPAVLVLSPRDRIARLQTVALKPGIDDDDRTRMEERVLEEQDLAAVVLNIGGIASYPSIVVETSDLRGSLDIIAHEWLHHWFFFRPLGRGYWDSPEMTTLNETAATIGGDELGGLAKATLGAELTVQQEAREKQTPAQPLSFDFGEAMSETRRRTEELLAQGRVEDAEAHMEQRRLLFVEQGYRIRRINQAYFAFRESYATIPGSISPIGGQMEELRRRSSSLGEFLKTVAEFASYGEFLEHLESGR